MEPMLPSASATDMNEVAMLAVGIAGLGVIGSVVPLVPGPILSLIGVTGYWWATAGIEPATPLLLALIGLAVTATVADYGGGAIAARAGGASTRVSILGGVVGIVGLLVLGPLGLLVGIVGTVTLLEIRRHGDVGAGVRTGLVAAIGTLASAAAQILLTGIVFIVLLGLVLT